MSVQAKMFGFGMPWESAFGFSQAVQAGDTLYISGQLSHDQEGNFLGADDFELQTRTSLANLDRVLEHHGAQRTQIVETTVLIRNFRENFETAARLHADYFGGYRPASTAMGVVD